MWEKLRSRRHVGKLRAEMSVIVICVRKRQRQKDFILILSSTCGCPTNHWMPSQASHQQPSLKSFKRNISTFLPTPWLLLVSCSTSGLDGRDVFWCLLSHLHPGRWRIFSTVGEFASAPSLVAITTSLAFLCLLPKLLWKSPNQFSSLDLGEAPTAVLNLSLSF